MICEGNEEICAALAHVGVEVWTYTPDDVNEIPCVMVARPAISVTPTLMTLTYTVYVVGRRLSDQDCSQELDRLADRALALLRGMAQSVEPTTVLINDTPYPAYAISTVLGGQFC